MGQNIVFIGAGNLATRLSGELKKHGHSVLQVYSRTEASASRLAMILKSMHTTIPEEILPDADIYFVALKDSVVDDVLSRINFKNHLVVHCSGSLSLSVLSKHSANTGVIYPLQTFSKQREVNFKGIPVFVEANSRANEKVLLNIAKEISEKVIVLNSRDRQFLHISAVFACNYVNHLYTVSSELLKTKNILFDVMHPLIRETAAKAIDAGPWKAQTGPAIRYDQNIISEHLSALEPFPDFRNLYEQLANSIFNYYKGKHQ